MNLKRHGASMARVGTVGLVIAGALFAQGRGGAQGQDFRLSVRPKEMAKGTKNPEAGEYKLESVKNILISIPPQGVGEKRCPLFVMLPGGGIPARQMMDWLRPVADKYGMIALTCTKYDVATIDSALKEVLENYAVDPEKLAVIGRCASGAAGTRFGIENLDVFSRIISVSGGTPVNGVDPENKTAEFLIDKGYLEGAGSIKAARSLRKGEHPAKVVLMLRGHEHQMEDYDYVGRWLQETWTKKAADRTAPTVVADPPPELTAEIMTKMTEFWTEFAKLPDEIRKVARRALLREVVVPLAEEKPTVVMTDMVTLAAKHTPVAEALKKAGLTAKEHDAWRIAMITAYVCQTTGKEGGAYDEESVLAKNLAFLKENGAAFKELRGAGVENPGKIRQVDSSATITHPRLAEEMGAMGIWRSP